MRCALLEQAKELGIQAGKPAPIVAACNQLGQCYGLDVVDLKQEALLQATKGNRTPADHRELALALGAAAEEAVGADRFESAKQLTKAAHSSARKSRDTDLAKEAAAHTKQIEAIGKEAEKTRPATKRFVSLPTIRPPIWPSADWNVSSKGTGRVGWPTWNAAATLQLPNSPGASGRPRRPAARPAAWRMPGGIWLPPNRRCHIDKSSFMPATYIRPRSQAGAGLAQTKLERRLGEVAALPAAPFSFRLATGWWRIAQRTSGKFIGVSEGSRNAGHPLIVWDSSGAEQHWRFEFDAQGWARLINRNSGLALGIREGSDRPGMDAIQWYAGGFECRPEHIAGETVRLVFRHGGLCLDAPEQQLIQSLPGETETQFWRLERAE